jgi:hypothetical protein
MPGMTPANLPAPTSMSVVRDEAAAVRTWRRGSRLSDVGFPTVADITADDFTLK